jgi:hypothetical protein
MEPSKLLCYELSTRICNTVREQLEAKELSDQVSIALDDVLLKLELWRIELELTHGEGEASKASDNGTQLQNVIVMLFDRLDRKIRKMMYVAPLDDFHGLNLNTSETMMGM